MNIGFIVKNQTIQTIFADFALFAVNKIIHRKGRKERKVFRIYVKDIMFLTIMDILLPGTAKSFLRRDL